MLNQHKAPSFTSTGQPPRSPHVPMGGMGLTPTVPQTLSAHSWSMAGAEASRQLTVCPLQLQHAPPGHTWGAVAPGWVGSRRLCSILHQTDMTTAIPGGPEQHCQEAKYLLGLWDSSNAQGIYFLLCRNRKPPTCSNPGPLPESGAPQQCSRSWTHLERKREPWECWVVPIWQEMPLAPWVEGWRPTGSQKEGSCPAAHPAPCGVIHQQ